MQQKSYKHTFTRLNWDIALNTASYKYYNLTLKHTLILTEFRMIFTNEDVPKKGVLGDLITYESLKYY